MSSFHTVELSDSQYENAGIRFLTIKSENLLGRGDICLYVPDVDRDVSDMPIYILLTGVYGSEWIWAMKGGAGQTACRMIESKEIEPAIIAMPSDGLWGDGSAYRAHNSYHYDKWIVEDVIKAVRENVPQAENNKAVCIGGLSMGGYGAMILGMQHGDKFAAISAHSSLTELSQMTMFVSDLIEAYEGTDSSLVDVIAVAQDNLENIPPLRFDCGTSDTLIEANRQLHVDLERLNIKHTYSEYDGGHEWSYWQKHVEKSYLFFDKHCSPRN